LFGTGVPGVEEFNGKSWKTKIKDNPSRLSVVVLFYEAGCPECEELKGAMREFGSEFASHGFVDAGAVNCGKNQNLCQKEQVADQLPSVRYYGPEGRQPERFRPASITYKGLSQWAAKVMADYCKVLSSEADLRRWLSSDDKQPHVVFFTDRKTLPPLMKSLSLEFRGRALIGVVLAGASGSLAKAVGVDKRPALVHITSEEPLAAVAMDKEFKREHMSRFLSRAVGKHRADAASSFRELTPARLDAGECAPTDSNFCLLYFSGPASVAPRIGAALRQVAQRLRSDPVKVFFVRRTGFADAFGGARRGAVVLYRPKRKRFKAYEGAADDADALAAFVDSAVGGGAPLPEAVRAAPSMSGGGAEL